MKKAKSILQVISGAALVIAGMTGMAAGLLGLIYTRRSRRESWD